MRRSYQYDVLELGKARRLLDLVVADLAAMSLLLRMFALETRHQVMGNVRSCRSAQLLSLP
jgi:hypothetical protein